MKDNVSVVVRRRLGMIFYTATGTEWDVRKWFAALSRQFHPAGYGTSGNIEETLPDGTVIFKASRSNSCD